MTQAIEEKNKAFVLEAFETLFNKRDYAAAERFWSSNYIQHSAHIPPGREGLFALVKGVPENFRYENGLTVANGDYVLLHGRFSNIGQPANGSWWTSCASRTANWLNTGMSIQDEATKEAPSVAGPCSETDFRPDSRSVRSACPTRFHNRRRCWADGCAGESAYTCSKPLPRLRHGTAAAELEVIDSDFVTVAPRRSW